MNLPRKLAGGVAALSTLGALSATPAGAVTASCVLTAQPFNNTQYALDVVHTDRTIETLLEQTYEPFEPRSWTFPLGEINEVRWAKDTSGNFYDRLAVAPGECRFIGDYANVPGQVDSITITQAPTIVPPTTSTSTTSAPPMPTTTAPLVTPPTITVDASTPTPVTFPTVLVDEPLTPSTSTFTASVPTLPATGGPQGFLAWVGLGVLAGGGFLVGITRRR